MKRAILLPGIVLVFSLAAGLTGSNHPFGYGAPERALDWAGILIVLGGILFLPRPDNCSSANYSWWRRPEVWTTAGGTALVAGSLVPAFLFLAASLWTYLRAKCSPRVSDRGPTLPLVTAWADRVRTALAERGLLLLGVGALLLLLKAWDTATAPGGPKVYQVELGCYGVLLALLGIVWAGRTDGTRALSPAVTDALARSHLTPSRLALAALVPLGILLLLAWLIRLPSVEAFDVAFIHRVYRSSGKGVTALLRTASGAGGRDLLVYWSPLVALLLAVTRHVRSLRFFAICQLGVFGLETIAKPLAYRLRPDFTHGRHFDSFPSGHTMAATILAGVLLLILLPSPTQRGQRVLLWTAVGLWPLLMGTSRVYLGRHYLTDVVGGILLGTAWVMICLAVLMAAAKPRRASVDSHHGIEGRKDGVLEAGESGERNTVRMKIRLWSVLLICLLALPAGAQPPPAPPPALPAVKLTAEEVVAAALRSHPLVRAAEQRLAAGGAHLRGARAPLNPEITLQHGAGRDASGLDEDINVTQVFELGGKRRYRGLEAEGARRRAEVALEAARLEVSFQARTAYLGVQEAMAIRDQALRFVDLAEQFRKTAIAQFEAGDAPRTQVVRAEIEVSTRRLALDQAEGELTARLAALNSLAARPLLADAGAVGPLPESPPSETLGMLKEWLDLAGARPEVRLAQAELEGLRAGIGSARAEAAPNLFLTGVKARIDEIPGYSVRAGITFPLFDRGLLRSRRAEARLLAAAGEADVAEARRQSELEVQTAFDAAARADQRLARYRDGQLERVKMLADLARVGYEAGHNSYLELLDAQRAYQETHEGYLRVLAEGARARLTLQRAAGSGRLLPDSVPAAGAKP